MCCWPTWRHDDRCRAKFPGNKACQAAKVAAGYAPSSVATRHRGRRWIREPRECFAGACVVEARSESTRSLRADTAHARAMPQQSAPGFCFWRDGFVVVNGRRRLRANGRPKKPKREGSRPREESEIMPMAWRNPGRMTSGAREHSAIAGTGRPATTTKPLLRPVARRHTSHAPHMGHRENVCKPV